MLSGRQAAEILAFMTIPSHYPKLSADDDPNGEKLEILANAGFRYEARDGGVFVGESPRRLVFATAVRELSAADLAERLRVELPPSGVDVIESRESRISAMDRADLLRHLRWT